jgi:hypothetical protein
MGRRQISGVAVFVVFLLSGRGFVVEGGVASSQARRHRQLV